MSKQLDDAVINYDDPMTGLILAPCPNLSPQHNRLHCEWCQTVAPRRFGDLGHIIGIVDLVDVHWCGAGCDRVPIAFPGLGTGLAHVLCSPWAVEYQHHLVLANPRPLLDPIPYRGQLGLFDIPDEVVKQGGAR